MDRSIVAAFCLGILTVIPVGSAQSRPDDCESRLLVLQAENTKLKASEQEVRARLAGLFYDKRTSLWSCNSAVTQIERIAEIPNAGPEGVIAEFNRRFASDHDPNVVFERLEVDTIFVAVKNPEDLTQRMGTAGASCFLASATYSLTSIDGIDYVWFTFEEGDHASPGRYSRYSFPYLMPLGFNDSQQVRREEK